jgi:DNA helicase-4
VPNVRRSRHEGGVDRLRRRVAAEAGNRCVAANPMQLDKPMRSAQPDPGRPVRVILADDPAETLAANLSALSADVAAGRAPSRRGGKVTVDILGRYQFDRHVLPWHWPKDLHVTFRTVHGSKGLEADHTLVVNMTSGTYGFPSGMADDPVLDLAMPEPESFEHAEERRLLYVALTRARYACLASRSSWR